MWPRVKLETAKLRKKRNEKKIRVQKASNYPLFMSEMTSNIILFEFPKCLNGEKKGNF